MKTTNKKQKSKEETQKTNNAECENAVSLRHGLGASLSDVEMTVLKQLNRYSLIYSTAEIKKKAYLKLIKNNFNLKEDDLTWKSIDEKPEFFESIRGKTLLSGFLL